MMLSQPFRFSTAVLVAVALLAAARPAHADTAPASIAVPLLGTRGAASVYPSTLTVVARGGASHSSPIWITLHAVTHPCVEDLAVLLVHNNTDAFLLMSNAGGCRALEGTDLTISPLTAPLPDTNSTDTPYGATLAVGASNYGTPPAFPAPAPPGPYMLGLPLFTSTDPNGTWALYVYDTTDTNRGVIAGGWTLHYDTDAIVTSTEADVALPVGPSFPGPAAVYPITFDLTTAPSTVTAMRVRIIVGLRHNRPDDVMLALQSPAGTTVVLMENAGGTPFLPAGTKLTFHDLATTSLPDEAAIVSGAYRPTSFDTHRLPVPAPALPYATTLAAFVGEPVRGTWKLWAADDSAGAPGRFESATLVIETERSPDYSDPSVDPDDPSTQPFVRMGHTVDGPSPLPSPHSAVWRVTNGGKFVDAGAFSFVPGTNMFIGEMPVLGGTNEIDVRVSNTKDASVHGTQTVTVDEFTYSLAEGATGSFFDLDIALANPTSTNALVKLEFLPEEGPPVEIPSPLDAGVQARVTVDDMIPGAAVSTVVHSAGVPLAVERTMIWDETGYGGHGGTAVAPAARWLFAEGSQGYFSTYVLLANANDAPVDVTVNFLLEGGGVVTYPVRVNGKKRFTLFAGSVPQLVNQSFGIDITASQPIIAERSMYLPGARLFEGGHESAGVNDTSKQWFLAEGATGSFFDCFVLISNPNATDAHVTLTYLLPSGTTIAKNVTVAAKGRLTINVETEDPQLANADVSTTIVSDIGIVAERAMYWPNISLGWREAHNSFGVTASALRWGLADGRIGGARGYQTFVLLANPNPLPAEVQVRFMKPSFSTIRTYTLDPSSRRSIYVNADVPELGDGAFGVEVQVLNYQPIAVEKALYWNSGSEVFAGGTNVTATRLPPAPPTP